MIGCGNVCKPHAGASDVAREGIRVARAVLGAGRTRLVRLLLVESLMLAIAGAALGVLVAWGWIEIDRGMDAAELGFPAESRDRAEHAPVMVFTLVVARIDRPDFPDWRRHCRRPGAI